MRNDFGTRPYKSRFGAKAAMKKGGKAKKMMGGGKVYASQNKKYGGGIYPKMGK